ncbi:MAG: IS481 family transposase [Negativicutes bacterium]|nr:IS481 family transposase [Negativicutes bacterium]
MNQEKMQNIALMRYSAISPLISGTGNDYVSLDAYFRAISDKGILHPDGQVKHYAPNTIEKWYRKYQKLGFNSLLPASRADHGQPRKLDHELQEQIKYLKTHYPRMSSSSIYRQLRDSGSITKGQVSESTVNRYVNLFISQAKTTTNQDMRRYERPHINEVWCGDSSVGPYLKTLDGKKHKVYIIALIDDASRFIVGIDIFFNDNFINLMSVMKSAVAKYGKPGMFNFDNGSSYKNKQMELLAARIGSVIHYDQPYSPTQKAKIERWFRTMKDQWMATLDIRDFHSLEELRGNLFAYVARYNQTVHSSLHGKSPQDRFFLEPERIKRLSEQDIENSFLLEIERRVSSDSVIVIDQIEYEVDCRFSKQRIRLRYSPSLENIFIVEADGTLTPIRLLNKHDNAFVKREKLHLCKGEE